MNQIRTIEQLTEALDDIDPLKHSQIMQRIRFSASYLKQYATWSKEAYTRNCLARTANYELILICWDTDSKTPIHDHGGENCWVYQIEGTVEEIRFQQCDNQLKELSRTLLYPGRLTFMNDRMGFHSLENNSNQRALTLHIYASPIDSCNVYNDKKDCFESKEMSYHSLREDVLEVPVY